MLKQSKHPSLEQIEADAKEAARLDIERSLQHAREQALDPEFYLQEVVGQLVDDAQDVCTEAVILACAKSANPEEALAKLREVVVKDLSTEDLNPASAFHA